MHLGYHGNVRHFEFYQHAKSFHTLRWIFLRCFMKFDKRNKKKLKIPPFLFPWQLEQKFVLPIPIILAYLVPLDVDVTGNITAKIYEVWSEFNIFSTLVTMATAAILNLFNLQKLRWIFLQSFMKFDERNPIFFKSLFFCFHGNCGKVCPTDSNFFFGLSRSTRCGCDRKHYCKILWKFGVNLNFFAPWLPWQRPLFWIFSTPQKLSHTTVDIPTKFHEV